MSTCNVRVIARFRPINSKELEKIKPEESKVEINFRSKQTVEISRPGEPVANFHLDHIFPPNTTQEEVYTYAAKPVIEDVLEGYNGTIFAYGQTGAGKTFTMFGENIDDPKLRGIVPRASRHIFQRIDETSDVEWQIKCSYLEIYNEKIRDLLDPGKANLKVHELPSRGVWVEGLTEEFIDSEEQIDELLHRGSKIRKTSSTGMNDVSSRSHSCFIIVVTQNGRDGIKTGRLNLVDLAGSEKVKKTNAEGQTLEEAKNINRSLSSLGKCIKALTERNVAHVPYRDSKLTHLLKESLGGNTKTTLLVACSPSEYNIEETLSTLYFAKSAKTIVLEVKVNRQYSVEELQKIVQLLKEELMLVKMKSRALELEIKYMKSPEYDPAKPFNMKEYLEKSGEKLIEGGTVDGENGDANAVQERLLSGDAGSAEDSIAKAELRAEIASLREKLQIQREGFAEDLERLREENEAKTHTIEMLQQSMEKTEAVLCKLQAEAAQERERWAAERRDIDYVRSQARLEIESLQRTIATLKERNSELTTRLSERESRVAALEHSTAQLGRHAEETHRRLVVAEQRSEQAEVRMRKMQQEIDANKRQNALLQTQASDMAAFVEQLERDLEAVSTELGETQEHLKAKRQQAEQLETALANERARTRELEAKLETMEATNQTDMEFLCDELQQTNAVKDELDAKLKRSEAARQQLLRSNEEMAAHTRALERAVVMLRDACSNEGVASQVDTLLAKARQEVEAMKVKHPATGATAGAGEEDPLKQVYEAKLEKLAAEVGNHVEQKEEIKKKMNAEVGRLKQVCNELQTAVDASGLEISKLKDQIMELRGEIEKEQLAKSHLESRLSNQEERLAAAQRKNDSLTEDLSALRLRNASLEQDLETSKKCLEESHRTVGELSQQKAVQEAEIQRLKLSISSLEQEVAAEVAKAGMQARLLQQQESRVQELNSELAAARAQQADLRNALEDLKYRENTFQRELVHLRMVNEQLTLENEQLQIRRRGNIFKPLKGTSATIRQAFQQKIDFGEYRRALKKVDLKEDVRKEIYGTEETPNGGSASASGEKQ